MRGNRSEYHVHMTAPRNNSKTIRKHYLINSRQIYVRSFLLGNSILVLLELLFGTHKRHAITENKVSGVKVRYVISLSPMVIPR